MFGDRKLIILLVALIFVLTSAGYIFFVEPAIQEGVVNLSEDIAIASSTIVATSSNTVAIGVGSSQKTPAASEKAPFIMFKDVGEPFLDHFGLNPSDFQRMKNAGAEVIQGNFDICASSEDVKYFLDEAKKAGLKTILPAGSGEAEWGYPCDGDFGKDLKPQWQKTRVVAWVNKWKNHPALYAWDISNEAGQNFPNVDRESTSWEKDFALTLPQLQQAYKDVKSADTHHPLMIRMNGWYFYDYESNFFRPGNPFGPNVADIVMINAYSNVDEYFSDFVSTVMSRATKDILSISPKTQFIVSLGAWEEPPLWKFPSIAEFSNDLNSAIKTKNLIGVGIFKYGAVGQEWFLPEHGSIWNFISNLKIK